MNENIFTLPNKLTFVRIFISFIATSLILLENIQLLYVAIILIAYSELTDMLDGYIARRDNSITDMGKLLDPLSDSISRFMYFFAFGVTGLFPVWLVLFLFTRDIIVAYIRTYMSLQGIAMGARLSGKIKALVQFCGQYLFLYMLILFLMQKGQGVSETFIIAMTLLGSITTFIILKQLRVHGIYLTYSILGYVAFLIPFYMINKFEIPFDTGFSTATMLLIIVVTLWSLWDYLKGLLEAMKE